MTYSFLCVHCIFRSRNRLNFWKNDETYHLEAHLRSTSEILICQIQGQIFKFWYSSCSNYPDDSNRSIMDRPLVPSKVLLLTLFVI